MPERAALPGLPCQTLPQASAGVRAQTNLPTREYQRASGKLCSQTAEMQTMFFLHNKTLEVCDEHHPNCPLHLQPIRLSFSQCNPWGAFAELPCPANPHKAPEITCDHAGMLPGRRLPDGVGFLDLTTQHHPQDELGGVAPAAEPHWLVVSHHGTGEQQPYRSTCP